MHDDKPDKGFVKLKLHRDPTSDNLYLCEFKMALFENGNPDGFLFFVCNFNMTLVGSVMLGVDVKVQYMCTLVCGEAFRLFGLLYANLEGTNPLTVEDNILGLDFYFYL